MNQRRKTPEPSRRKPTKPPASPKKPTWSEVFASLDAAQFRDDFLEDRYAGISPIPDERENLQS